MVSHLARPRHEVWSTHLAYGAAVTPSADDFLALARSSPWRWTSLHLVRGEAEARVRRPEGLRVRVGSRTERHDGWPYGSSADEEPVWPTDVPPELRPDGLVARRPDDPRIRWGDAMYQDYTWVAMLDPVELSHGIEVLDVRRGERFGRPTWEARVRPSDDYDPTCSCCPLLWSEVSDRYEFEERPGTWQPTATYPEAHEVALDAGTSVAVRVEDLGGDRSGVQLEVEILEVG